jgi:signal transduction histidine kinase
LIQLSRAAAGSKTAKSALFPEICFILYPVSPLLQKNISRTFPSDDDSQSKEQSQKLRQILLTAFGGLLLLLILSGLDAFLSVRKLGRIEQEVNRRFAAHGQALSAIVISVHAYDDQMEQYLLQEQTAEHTTKVFDAVSGGAEVHAALLQYPLDQEPEEQLLLKELERGLVEQETSFAAVSVWSAEDRHQRAHHFVGEQLIPQRMHILQVSEQISLLNGRKLDQQKEALAVNFRSVQTRLQWMVTLTLTAGILLSLVSGLYILRLERQGRQRYQALARSRQELEGLSAQLVDAQEEERRSISRELHDEVGQTLGALLVDLAQLAKLVAPEDRVIQGQIAHIKSAAETAVRSIRHIALLLRPSMLDDLGLVPALEWQAREVSRRSEMEVEVHSENVSDDLLDEIRVCIYRLVQEALNNAATHAAARNAKVTVSQHADKIAVEVTDDGHGFDSERQRGMGLLGMEERVRRLGGKITIQSAPGKSTTVKTELPIHPTEDPLTR